MILVIPNLDYIHGFTLNFDSLYFKYLDNID